MDISEDAALRQLRRLREGPGLQVGRLAAAGDLLSALGTSDPVMAVNRLGAELAALGSLPRYLALQVDFGLNLESLLGRPPVTREIELLGERRQAYALKVTRNVKTLARWSDRASVELRHRLIDDVARGDVYVTGVLRDGALAAITLTRDDLTGSQLMTDGPEATHSDGPPLLMYALPRDWRPRSLGMAVVAQQGSAPTVVWLLIARDLLSLPTAGERHLVSIVGDSAFVRVVKPRTDRLYALWWRYE
jgi:hypothetical protein